MSTKDTKAPHSTAAPARQLHLSMQGKGGIGKSLVAAMIAQFLRDSGQTVTCYDTDPVNATFARYARFKAEHVNLFDGGMDINASCFDSVFNRIATSTDQHTVIDSGATSFLPLAAYMASCQIVPLLQAEGVTTLFHCVLSGGQDTFDTLNGFESICEYFPTASVVVWLNEFRGPINSGGKPFLQSELFAKRQHQILGGVVIPQQNSTTFAKDMMTMLEAPMTFEEAIQPASGFGLINRQRLILMRNDIYEQIQQGVFRVESERSKKAA
jgi:hypothetical protein